MIYKNTIFVVHKDNEKESTGGISIPDKDNKITLFSGIKGPFQDNLLSFKANDFFIKSDAFSEYDNSFSNEDFNFGFDHSEIFSFIKNNEINEMNRCFDNYNYLNENTFKKNRNNLNNNFFKITKDKIENNNNNCTSETSSSNHNSKIIYSKNRSDSLLIKFKSFLGKSFIKNINYKLSNMSKRKIKFFSFNYKKFTLNVTYNQNKIWLNEKVKDLLIFGDEPNQIKNEKSLKSLYNKKDEVFNEIKNLLELTYKEIIERFYLSKYFEEFKKDKDILLLNENFQKVKNISILEKNGFINFIYKEKGNIKKSD